MQVQAGRYRGRKIRHLPSRDIRPCSSRVKKSLFDTLAARIDFDGIEVLDLFAGFGNLGFEALSRGARSACFVEQNRQALETMKATASDIGVQSSVRFVMADVTAFLKRNEGPFDLVFCDPPYRWEDYEHLIRSILDTGLLAPGGLLLMEHHASHDFSPSRGYLFHKDYGTTRVSFFTPETGTHE
ncbi:16S rRNA (guanine(966)-N(2))-methyltransferase RsmD [Chlorobaculum sp. 24CR]|uniref:16S rRNA (guanine(966)-N(2))-methyltransferase RsmD n=1 Tax=Chlorobaculum sp. 24CR TaxID=2508878 RepID=UPI00100BAEA1|nr:16S rRNA (guanine(966)-N(2))-methyltransferase RsmD [Chlorobaculum sp. 24CR]RXK89068.1 16S rRNA (guanine(966)-N(2))-methyltransferase RsmD [Chlorobaculum sp. 24CR]